MNKYYEVNIWTNERGTIDSATLEDKEKAERQFNNWKTDINLNSSRYPKNVILSLYEWEECDFADEYKELERYELEEED